MRGCLTTARGAEEARATATKAGHATAAAAATNQSRAGAAATAATAPPAAAAAPPAAASAASAAAAAPAAPGSATPSAAAATLARKAFRVLVAVYVRARRRPVIRVRVHAVLEAKVAVSRAAAAHDR
jgi:hypothetical protein